MKLGNGFSLLLAVLAASVMSGVGHASNLTGMVRKVGRGDPIPGATVMVYSASARKGYGTVCPTCVADAGKFVTTDLGGNFSIGGLDNQLVFDLLVFADGLKPTWIRAVDLLDIAELVEIQVWPLPAAEPAGTVLGRVIDARGLAVSHALVQLVGLDFGGDHPISGNFEDGLAVSDANGLFEIRSAVSRVLGGALPKSLIVEVKPQGMAPALHSVPVRSPRLDLRVTDGATVRGRVVAQGKPVFKAQLMLVTSAQDADERYEPIYIGTDKDGRFSITDVPAGRQWSLDATTDSGLGSVAARDVTTPTDGETVDLGDVEVQKGSALSGRVELSDSKFPPPVGVRVSIKNAAGGSRNTVLDADGKFEFKGLSGSYQLVPPDVSGYRLRGPAPEVSLERNVKGLKITLEPQPPAR